MRYVIKIFASLALAASMAAAQSMESAIAKMGKAGAEAYMAPILSGIGSNLNAGWYHKTPPAVKHQFHVNAGIVSMGTVLNGDKTMDVSGSMRLDTSISRILVNKPSIDSTVRDSLKRRLSQREFDVKFKGPTIIGSEAEEVQIIFEGRYVQTGLSGTPNDSVFVPSDTVAIANLMGLLDGLSSLSLFMPQITVGTLYGTNVTLRWLPVYETLEEIGAINVFGFGFQHNPTVWLKKPLPVDISLGYFHQSLEGEFFKASASAFGLHVSKLFDWRVFSLSPYAGVQLETSSFDVEYDLIAYDEVQRVKSSLDGANTYRATAGISARLLAINVAGDVNYSQNPSYSLTVMIGL